MRVDYGYTVEAKGVTAPLYRQVHGNAIVEVNAPLETPPEADGAYTTRSDFTLSVFTADCVPLLFFGKEPETPIAAVHAGWRGTLAGIGARAVSLLAPRTPTLHVALGPAILRCCFEVKEDFVAAFREAGRDIDRYLEKKDGIWRCDLIRFLRKEELSSISDDRVLTRDLRCTVCSAPRLPSYRRDHATDPRIRSWIRKSGS